MTEALLVASLLVVSPIVGGGPAAGDAWPEVVALVDALGAPRCTGTLVAPDAVLTSAHCVALGAPPAEVVAGHQRARVTGWQLHPEWRRTLDLALLHLEQPLDLVPRGLSAPCVTDSWLEAGAPVVLVGFGDGARQEAARSTVTDPWCSEGWACNPAAAPYGEMVVGHPQGDACHGDSGGPVLHWLEGEARLVGVTSRSVAEDGACGTGTVAVQTDAALAWIISVVGAVDLPACAGQPDPDTGGWRGETLSNVSPGRYRGGCDTTHGALAAGWLLALGIRRRRVR